MVLLYHSGACTADNDISHDVVSADFVPGADTRQVKLYGGWRTLSSGPQTLLKFCGTCDTSLLKVSCREQNARAWKPHLSKPGPHDRLNFALQVGVDFYEITVVSCCFSKALFTRG